MSSPAWEVASLINIKKIKINKKPTLPCCSMGHSQRHSSFPVMYFSNLTRHLLHSPRDAHPVTSEVVGVRACSRKPQLSWFVYGKCCKQAPRAADHSPASARTRGNHPRDRSLRSPPGLCHCSRAPILRLRKVFSARGKPPPLRNA